MPGPADLFAQIQAGKRKPPGPPPSKSSSSSATTTPSAAATPASASASAVPITIPEGSLYAYDSSQEAFVFAFSETYTNVRLDFDDNIIGNNKDGDIVVPLAPCIYRMTDYTYAKRQPIALHRVVLKLGVLRCLARECETLNHLLWHRFHPILFNSSEQQEEGSVGNNSLPEMTPLWKDDNDKKTDKPVVPRRPYVGTMEEEELGKARFMELLSNCGVYQKVSELVLQRGAKVADAVLKMDPNTLAQTTAAAAAATAAMLTSSNGNDADIGNSSDDGGICKRKNPYGIPQVRVDGLDEFLNKVESLVPALAQARETIESTHTVSFHPGLGELYSPGSQLLCYPEGMEGSPLGCSVVQCWYDEEVNPAITSTIKRKFVLVVEFIVSVGEELVFVAASDVYPEFHDPNRNVPIKDLSHRKLLPASNADDAALLQRLQERGEFYASVATKNHYLEYDANSFFPIISGSGWRSQAIRPLTKGGRVMVDVHRGILEGHFPVRSSSTSNSGTDGLSDTVKEAIKLFEQSKRTGVAVPFRTCILPEFASYSSSSKHNNKQHNTKKNLAAEPRETILSDRPQLWQAWPMLTGFSFTARVWGKLLLAMPKVVVGMTDAATATSSKDQDDNNKKNGNKDNTLTVVTLSPGGRRPALPGSVSPRRQSRIIKGVQVGGLGGEGSAGNCGYIQFQEKAFDQLVLAEEKKELIRAVARNAGGGGGHDAADDDNDDDMDDSDDDDDDESNNIGLDVVANKGGASIFLLHGPPGCGKTLTAEAIAELLRKPLYIVTAGDLGITASEVEHTLGSVLELCQTWDALVLMDEADVFLEARTSTEIQRNALVCVMLRLLEYYSGCLFLSSNRAASSIDAAIASRITVMLGYPPLDADGRAKVWKNLIELVPAQPKSVKEAAAKSTLSKRKASKYRVDFTDDDYQRLGSGYELNGRQIKNSIVLARALARERGMPLSIPILHRAVTAVAGEGAAVDTTMRSEASTRSLC